MRRTLLLATVSFLAALTPARATHAAELPLLAGGGDATGGWVSLVVSTDGSPVGIDIGGHDADLPNHYGLAMYEMDDRSVFGFMFTATTRSKDGVFVDMSATGVPGSRQDALGWPSTSGFTGMALTLNPSDGTSIVNDTLIGGKANARSTVGGASVVGTFKLLLWAAGDAADWVWSVRGGPGVDVARDGGDVRTDGGSSTFVHSLKDMESIAGTQVFAQQAGARVTVAARRSEAVQNRLVGSFSMPTVAVLFPPAPGGWANADRATVQGPAGERVCPCIYTAMTGGLVAGPGTYTFHVSGAGMASGGLSDVFLGGADARLID